MDLKTVFVRLGFVLDEFDRPAPKPGEPMRKAPKQLVAELFSDLRNHLRNAPVEPPDDAEYLRKTVDGRGRPMPKPPAYFFGRLLGVVFDMDQAADKGAELPNGDVRARLDAILNELSDSINLGCRDRNAAALHPEESRVLAFAGRLAEPRASFADVVAALPEGFTLTVTAPGPFEDAGADEDD